MGGAEAVHLLEETRSMTHRNSPLTPAGRLRLVKRVEDDGRPVAHVAAEAGVARSTLTKWVHRYRADGAEALEDRTSAPARRPSRPPIEVLELIDAWRREHKWSARRIALELASHGHHYCVRTIGRWLERLGISRRQTSICWMTQAAVAVLLWWGVEARSWSPASPWRLHRLTHFEAHAREMPISAATCAIGRVRHRFTSRRRPSRLNGALACVTWQPPHSVPAGR